MLQTSLGWLFRELTSSLGESSAIRYFRRLTSWNPQQTLDLRKALGVYYKPKYEVILEYIQPQEFNDIKFLAEGKNGRVLSASWNPPRSLGHSNQQCLSVVLKHIHDQNEKGVDNPLAKFLHEVRSIVSPATKCQMEIVYEVLSSSPGGCIKFYGITNLSVDQGFPIDTLCLVFERATRGTILDFLSQQATSLDWYEVINMFISIAWALDDGLHKQKVVHRYQHLINTDCFEEIFMQITF